MAYKRTTRKSGNFRTTDTRNTNGTSTHSSSVGTKGGTRTTTSRSSNGGMKTTQTYKDGGGYIHTKTIYKSETAAARKRKDKEAREFWAGIFGTKKKKPTKRTTPRSVNLDQSSSPVTYEGGFGPIIVLGIIAIIAVMMFG